MKEDAKHSTGQLDICIFDFVYKKSLDSESASWHFQQKEGPSG